MAHQRFRRFNTGMYYKDHDVKNEMCMAVRAGNLIFLRGQTGFTFEGGFVGHGDAAARRARVRADEPVRERDDLRERVARVPPHLPSPPRRGR